MKLVRKDITPQGPGTAKLVPEEADDLWHVYNLVSKGDKVVANTVRKVQRESSSGDRDVERVKLKLEIEVKAIDYDNVAAVLRIRGKNVSENEHVKIGAFHTIEIETQRPFELKKDVWDSVALDTLKQACDPGASADLAVILMQEGLAHIFLVGRSVTTTKARIEAAIPRKRGPAIAGYEKGPVRILILCYGWAGFEEIFENVLQSVLRHSDFTIVRCMVIASPGFTKDQFHSYMLLEAERRELRSIIENKSRIVLAHASSGYKHSLGEVLDAPNVMSMIKDTKAAQEVKALKDFHEMMSNDPARACYGPKHVQVAHEQLAIQTLLLTDELFRNADIQTRKKYVELAESVKNAELQQLTGIAAILRFPMPELEDLEM